MKGSWNGERSIYRIIRHVSNKYWLDDSMDSWHSGCFRMGAFSGAVMSASCLFASWEGAISSQQSVILPCIGFFHLFMLRVGALQFFHWLMTGSSARCLCWDYKFWPWLRRETRLGVPDLIVLPNKEQNATAYTHLSNWYILSSHIDYQSVWIIRRLTIIIFFHFFYFV